MKKRNFTNSEKIAGERAVERLSETARKFYDETDPLAVYEYDTEDGKAYAYDLCGDFTDGLSFEELEKDFEDLLEIVEG